MEKFKTQEETYYLHNTTIVPREIVFMLIVRRYNVVSNKSKHEYFPQSIVFRTLQRTHLCKSYHSDVHTSYGFMKIW